MKKLITICAVMGILLTVNVDVKAVLVTFDFNSLSNGDNAATISTYMTNIYTLAGYGSITVTDAEAHISSADWPGNTTTYIWTAVKNDKDFEILFVTTPITALWGIGGTGSTVGLVKKATTDPDFHIFAYDSNYGNVETPDGNALVTSWSVGGLGDKTQVAIPDLSFSRPVSLLVISDDSEHHVAIDNLMVTPFTPIPEPATIGLLGIGSLALLRKRRARNEPGLKAASQSVASDALHFRA